MLSAARGFDFTREFALILPRTLSGLAESTGWSPATPRGMRQFGEVMADELVLAGFSLLGAGAAPTLRPLSSCAAAAEQLSTLGIDRAHAEPAPIAVSTTHRRRIGVLAYERVTFEHDPALPSALEVEGLGGPATAVVHVCRHRDGPRPWLVWVHGAGQGRPEDLLVSRAGRLQRHLGSTWPYPCNPATVADVSRDRLIRTWIH